MQDNKSKIWLLDHKLFVAVDEKNHMAEWGGGIVTTYLHLSVDLSQKSIFDILQLYKESHSLVFLLGMRRLWDFTLDLNLNLEW